MPIRATYLIGALIPNRPSRPKGLKEEMRNIDISNRLYSLRKILLSADDKMKHIDTSNHLYSLRKDFVISERQDGKL